MPLNRRLDVFLKKTFNDDVLTLSAALAYFSALAMAPIIIILMSLLSFLNKDLQSELKLQTLKVIGNDAQSVLDAVINNTTNSPNLSLFAGWVGIFLLAVSGSVVFAQLHSTLNKIFMVNVKKIKNGVKTKLFNIVSKRLFSVIVLLLFVLFLIASLVFSTFITHILSHLNENLINFMTAIINIVMFSFLFSILFKWIPDREIKFIDSFKAGAVTAVFFLIGKMFISMYISHLAINSAYGAAGSLVAMLIWIYYSALIFLLGAEFLESFL